MALRIKVCAAGAVPPDEMRAFAVEGVETPVLVANVDGELIATSSMCPHEDVSLADGEVADGVVVCPGHAYEFDLRSGRCGHDAKLVLRRYKSFVHDGFLFIDLM